MAPFERLGRFAVRRARWVVGAWLVLLAAAAPLAPFAGSVLRGGGYSLPDLEAARARAILEREIGASPSAMIVVIQSDSGARAGDPAFEQAAAAVTAELASAPHVTGVLSHALAPRQVSADRRTVYDIVTLDLSPDDSPQALPGVRAALRDAPGIHTLLAGAPVFYSDMQHVSEQDLQRSELLSFPLAAIALVAVFGSLLAAGVPLVVGGASVLVALAAIFLIAQLTPMSIFVLNLATLLGLGLGVDYSLVMTSRFREELAARGGGRLPDGRIDRAAVDEAVITTVATAGRAVFFSGLAVLLGVLGLLLFGFMILRSVGIAGALVVGLAVLSALTLLPAVLVIIGPRLEWLSVRRVLSSWSPVRSRRVGASAESPRAPRPTPGHPPTASGGWARLANWVMDRPLRVFVPTLALLLLLGVPFLHVRFNAPDASILPERVPSRQAFDLLVREFGAGDFAPLSLAIRTSGPAIDPANVSLLYDYARRLEADPRVTRVQGIVSVDPRLTRSQYQLLLSDPSEIPDQYLAATLAATTRGDLTTFNVFTPYGPNHPAGRALVEELRDPRSGLAPPGGLTVLVAGGAAEVVDVVDRIAADFPRTALFILISTYLVLFLLLRSVVLPAKALVMNALSLTAAFGALVWVFQDGNLSALLGFQPLGFVETSQPVVLFCVLFGLSMDYEVFLLTRIREVHDQTGDNRQAVARGLERSGRIITSAALIVVLVAGSFAFAEVVLIKTLGIGMAVAVALDATIVRALLVPATMRLLGDWNWWVPRALARWMRGRLPIVEGALLPQLLVLVAMVALLAGACSPSGRILANEPAASPAPAIPPVASPTPGVDARDPQPVRFPSDEAPHRRLTEWWYYTGHLAAGDGRRFGFEFVIFRAERGSFPVSWASHVALTDESGRQFRYEQRTEIGAQADRSAPGGGFDLAIQGGGPRFGMAGQTDRGPAWSMRGEGGRDELLAASPTAGFSLQLHLDAGTREPVLHQRIGYVDFGPAGGSYYYSRTRMAAQGALAVDGGRVPLRVEGIAWFDHQWGDFIPLSARGGWDWFAVNLSDGSDLMVSMIRNRGGSYPLAYAELVHPNGVHQHLDRDAFAVRSRGTWTSPATGMGYPSGWVISIPSQELTIDLRPTVADQELDTRASTGVVYWEGSQVVRASRAGRSLGGEAYVELTGYGR